MTQMILLSTLLFFHLATAEAAATVNTQEGSFLWSTTDLIPGLRQKNLHLEREYSSRSDRRGILSLGWCDELEWSLAGSGSAALLDRCGNVEPVASADLESVRGQRRLKYHRHKLYFGSDGRLEAIEESAKLWRIQWDLAGRPARLQAKTGEATEFLYSPSFGWITALQTGATKRQLTYEKGLLQSVGLQSVGSLSTESYTYDDLDNLTRISAGSLTLAQVTYDSNRDTVLSVRTDGCETRYEYTSRARAQVIEDLVVRSRQCQHQLAQIVRDRYEYRKSKDHQIRLERRSSLTERGAL